MKKMIASIMLLCFVATGCTGSFNLTKKVYNYHRSQSDKWQDELIFLVCVIVPVYGISTFADAIVFNSIEFWTGENPVTMSSNVKTDDGEATLSYNPQNEQITVAGKDQTVILEKGDQMVMAKNDQGELLYSSTMTDRGEVMILDRDMQVVKTLSASQVNSIKEKMAR